MLNAQRCVVRWHDVPKTRVAPAAIAPVAASTPRHTWQEGTSHMAKAGQRQVVCYALPETCPDLSAYLKLKRQQGDGSKLLTAACLASTISLLIFTLLTGW